MRFFSLIIALSLVFFQATNSSAGEKEEALGKQLYMSYCEQCHGAKGIGDGPNVKASDMDPAPRDLCDVEQPYMKNKDNGYLIKVITEGGLGIDKSALMPKFQHTLSEYEILSIVAFIRTLHKNEAPPLDFSKANKTQNKITVGMVKTGEASRRDIMMGKKVYKKFGCSGCHAINERGGSTGGDLTAVGSKLDADKMWKVIKYPRSLKKDSKMPAFNISEDTGELLVKYLMSLQG